MRVQYQVTLVTEASKFTDENILYSGGDFEIAKKIYDNALKVHPENSYRLAYLTWMTMYHNK